MKFLLILSLFLSQLFSQDTIWQGTIGTKAVYMVLACDPFYQQRSNENGCFHSYYFETDHLKRLFKIKKGELK